MKKFVLIFFFALSGISVSIANKTELPVTDKIDESHSKCEDMIIPMKEFEEPLGQVLGDQSTAGKVIWCFSDKIKQHSTPQQFELYEKAKVQAEDFLDALLYYKGYVNYSERSELMYRYQSFIYHALTKNKDFALIEPDKINCPLNDKITEVPMCLKQDILKYVI